MAKELRPEDAAAQRLLADAVRNSGRSQDSIGKEVGISQNRVSTILRGATPPVTVGELLAIAAAVGVSGAEIIEKAATEARLAASAQAAPEAEETSTTSPAPTLQAVPSSPVEDEEELPDFSQMAARTVSDEQYQRIMARKRFFDDLGEGVDYDPDGWAD